MPKCNALVAADALGTLHNRCRAGDSPLTCTAQEAHSARCSRGTCLPLTRLLQHAPQPAYISHSRSPPGFLEAPALPPCRVRSRRENSAAFTAKGPRQLAGLQSTACDRRSTYSPRIALTSSSFLALPETQRTSVLQFSTLHIANATTHGAGSVVCPRDWLTCYESHCAFGHL